MHRTSFVALIAACSSTPRGMTADPVRVVAPARPSTCGDEASCRAECDRDSAGACAKLADLTYLVDRTKARRLYEKACDGNQPAACVRLTELAGSELRAADRFTRLACGAGDPISCALLSEASLLAFVASRRGEDPDALFALSEASSRRACELGSYRSCLNAVTLLRHRGADRSEIGTLAARALKLAEVECANNSLGSCGFVADWAAAAHDDARAVSFYLAQCRLERRTLDSTAQPASLSSCKKAAVGREMSAVLAATEPAPSRESEERLVPQRALEATRVAGITQIQPPDSERLAMRKRAQVAVFKLCLSKWGGVRSVSVLRASRHARWNRRLFEAMRGWRYSPFRIDGRPVPVCTSVTFIFKPTR